MTLAGTLLASLVAVVDLEEPVDRLIEVGDGEGQAEIVAQVLHLLALGHELPIDREHVVKEELEVPVTGAISVLLAHLAADGISRVGEVERRKVLLEGVPAEDHLGADTAREGHRELASDVLELNRVVCHDLAGDAVAASDRVDHLAALVVDLEADAVVLLLHQEQWSGLLSPGLDAVTRDLVEGSHRDAVLLRR